MVKVEKIEIKLLQNYHTYFELLVELRTKSIMHSGNHMPSRLAISLHYMEQSNQKSNDWWFSSWYEDQEVNVMAVMNVVEIVLIQKILK